LVITRKKLYLFATKLHCPSVIISQYIFHNTKSFHLIKKKQKQKKWGEEILPQFIYCLLEKSYCTEVVEPLKSIEQAFNS